jgi:hypothetical protein
VGHAGENERKIKSAENIFLKILLVIGVSFWICFELNAQCTLRKNQDSIKVFTCHTDSSKFKSIVAEFFIHTSLTSLSDFVLDIPKYTQWQFNTIESKIIKKISNTEMIYRTVIEAPWPVTDRDMVVHITSEFSDGKMLNITTDSESGIVSIKEGLVRVPSSHAEWIVKEKSKNHLEVKYMMQIDPGGSVPAWLVNWVCANAPYQSFKNLKVKLEKK